MNEPIANQSPDHDHATASSGSSVNQIRITDKKSFWTATALALSIIVNVACGWALLNAAKEQRLKQYDLDWFKSADFAQLRGQVEMHDKMINVYLLRKECIK
jgi:hypothetical protein